MATKHSLVSRWASPEGQLRTNALIDALKRGTVATDLRMILAGFDYADEVAPALDLRGIQIGDFVPLRHLDLTGARLDYAEVGGYINNCRLVDAVFDEFRAENAYFGGDFHRASFVKAYLKGCRFYADLTGANFSGANLRSAIFSDGKCRSASFEGANLTLSMCARVDFRGANLSGSDFRGATLGGMRFNNETRLEGTNITDASMDDAFIWFATQHGAIFGPPSGTYEFAQFTATLGEIERTNDRHQFDGVLKEMYRLQDIMARDPLYDWSDYLGRVLPLALMEQVLEALREATSNM